MSYLPKLLALAILVTLQSHFVQLRSIRNAKPIVQTELGFVKGSTMESALGRTIYAFRGIRYAKAPVDELRFQPPVPVEKWNDTYDATRNGGMCPQPTLPSNEDCLNLNVYTTKLPTKGDPAKRPVIVYIHTGAFQMFSANSLFMGPEYLADQDVVLVAINYRLGALGFLSTGDQLAPGNNGMKDQVLALRWVQRHISAFGGDPNLVTLFGYSAGSMSVMYHMFSPMSRGLFHRAMAMSGASFATSPVSHDQMHLTKKQARILDCADDTSENIISCLKTKSAKEFARSLAEFYEFRADPMLTWLPVVEPDFGQERFLVEDITVAALNGRFAQVPFVTGLTRDEFADVAYEVATDDGLLTKMDRNFEKLAPICFLYERQTEHSKQVSKQLRKFYFGERSLDNSSLPGLINLYSDGIIGFGVNRAAKLFSAKNSQPVYYYHYTYKSPYSHFYLPGTKIPLGVIHHDDLMHLMYDRFLFPLFDENSAEFKMVKRLTTILGNFALTGNPTPVEDKLFNKVTWKPFTNKQQEYLEIGEELVIKKRLNEGRYNLWQNLFPVESF